MEKALVMIAALRASQTHPLLSQAYSTIIECDHANTSTGINASVDPDQEMLPTMASEVKMGWGMPPAKLQDLSLPEERDKDRGLFSSMTMLLSLRVAEKWNMDLIMYETDAWPEFKVLTGELGTVRTKDRSIANFFASPQTVGQLLDILARTDTMLVLCDTRVVEELYFSRRSVAFDLLLPPPGESVPSHVIVTNRAPAGRPLHNPLSAMAYFYHRISCCSVGKHCIGCDRLLKTLDRYCGPQHYE